MRSEVDPVVRSAAWTRWVPLRTSNKIRESFRNLNSTSLLIDDITSSVWHQGNVTQAVVLSDIFYHLPFSSSVRRSGI
jgi:hypothetical protein